MTATFSSDDDAGMLAGFTVGSGPLGAVLLHGFLGSGKNLRTLASKWVGRDPRQRFLLPDLLGHGDSPALPTDTSMDVVARAVLRTAAALDFALPLRVIGHSLGGRVALACARIAPEAIADVVLLDIGPGPIDKAKSETRQVLDVMLSAPDEVRDRRGLRTYFIDQGLSPALSDWILMNLKPSGEGYRWRVDRSALDRLHTTFTADDLWPVVEAQLVPVHVALGGRSSYVPSADVERMRQLGCEVHVLPDAGHYVHVDALEALLDWLVDLP